MSRPLVSVRVLPGEDEHGVWLRHQVASIGEGCCPYCAARLQPTETPKGTGGTCPDHGIFHADPHDATGWEMVCNWADHKAMSEWRSAVA